MYSQEEISRALKTVAAAIRNCKKVHPKFPAGSPQHSLLRNRIKALEIAEGLLRDDGKNFTTEELENSLPPIVSIRSKTSHARQKYEAGTSQYKRFTPTIEAMDICRALVEDEIARRTRG